MGGDFIRQACLRRGKNHFDFSAGTTVQSKPGSSDAQPFRQSVQHPIHFLFRQRAELTLQLDGRDGLNLLQMERAWLQERLGNGKLPTVATQRGSVKKDGDKIEFVVTGIACECKAG